ncbi:hypothetical protein BTM29_08880 [Companilactobacillus allii]|uniref:Ferrous iron transporter FeoA-like domain-containing protein n=1 Tax=Companilactobacillus allii TaxID=1847728 RepID=A0A1P8Q6B1_9LACO|nr:hypothetical protein BTM29_08880 [Companilactobacillus allii]
MINQVFTVCNIEELDDQTMQRLHSLGIHNNSNMTVIRFFPLHGPVIVEVDHQQIGIRYKVFKLLAGEDI